MLRHQSGMIIVSPPLGISAAHHVPPILNQPQQYLANIHSYSVTVLLVSSERKTSGERGHIQ